MSIIVTLFNNIASIKKDYVKCVIDLALFGHHPSICPLRNCAVGMNMSHLCIFLLADI